MTDDRKHVPRRDPEPSEIEVDEANEEFGGPTTESLEAGLSSSPQPGDATVGGGPETRGSKGAGGGSMTDDATEATVRKQE